jgi:hypothetical protein
MEGAAGVGCHDLAWVANQKLDAQLIFKPPQLAAQCGFGNPRLGLGLCEAPHSHDQCKRRHELHVHGESVHKMSFQK